MSRYRGVERFGRYRTPVALMLDKVFGPPPSPSPGSDDYDPAWEPTRFTQLTQDADGWTVHQLAADSRIMYVSEAGDDLTGTIYGPTAFANMENPNGAESAYRTAAAAEAQRRPNKCDWVLYRRGDSWDFMEPYPDIPIGQSSTLMHRVGCYGDEAQPRPFFDVFHTLGGSNALFDKFNQNLAITGLDIDCTWRDPTAPRWMGWKDLNAPQFFFAFTSDVDRNGLLIEDVRVRRMGRGMALTANALRYNDIKIRRCSFDRFYQGFSIGINNSRTSQLLEENVFHHIGWYDKYIDTVFGFSSNSGFVESTLWSSTISTALTGAAETSIVCADPIPVGLPADKVVELKTDLNETLTFNFISFTGNTFTIAATDFSGAKNVSIGNGIAESGFADTGEWLSRVTTTLSGAAETSVVVDTPIPTNLPADMWIVLKADNGAEVELQFSSFTGSAFTIAATDFSTNTVTAGNQIKALTLGGKPTNHSVYSSRDEYSIYRNITSIRPSYLDIKQIADEGNLINSESVSIYNNLFVDSMMGSGFGGNINSTSNPRFSDYLYANNTQYDIAATRPANSNNPHGVEARDCADSDILRNRFLYFGSSTDSYPVKYSNIIQNVTIAHNISINLGEIESTNDYPAIPQTVDQYGNAIDVSGFVDSTRRLSGFLTSKGITPGADPIETFAELVVNRRKGDWNTLPVEFKAYIDAGFAYAGNIKILNQPVSASFSLGNPVQRSVNAYSDRAETYQWKYTADGTAIAGQTSRIFSLAEMTAEWDGVSIYCTITNPNASVDSDPITLSISSRLFVSLTFPETVAIDIPAIKVSTYNQLTTGRAIRFMFRSTNTTTTFMDCIGGTNTFIRFKPSANIMEYQGSGLPSTTIEVPDLAVTVLDGQEHEIYYKYTGPGTPLKVSIDGVEYGPATETLYPLNFPWRFEAFKAPGSPENYSAWDFEVLEADGSVIAKFAMDSGAIDGATESASVGTGTMTFNVDAGSWS